MKTIFNNLYDGLKAIEEFSSSAFFEIKNKKEKLAIENIKNIQSLIKPMLNLIISKLRENGELE